MNWAWLAGLYEGEGTLYPRKDCGGWNLAIQMTDLDVLLRAQEVAGVGTVVTRKTTANRKPAWIWYVSRREDVRLVVESILPYLGERRTARAMECLAVLDDNVRRRVMREEQRAAIVHDAMTSGDPQRLVAARHGCSRSQVSRLVACLGS